MNQDKWVCDVCKKETRKKEMLWVVWEDRYICKGCYSRQLEKGLYSIVQPLDATISWLKHGYE